MKDIQGVTSAVADMYKGHHPPKIYGGSETGNFRLRSESMKSRAGADRKPISKKPLITPNYTVGAKPLLFGGGRRA